VILQPTSEVLLACCRNFLELDFAVPYKYYFSSNNLIECVVTHLFCVYYILTPFNFFCWPFLDAGEEPWSRKLIL
jgi:hypothetical protein